MAANVIPTKGNLMAQRRSLSLAQMGYELMDKKRNVLIREMMLLINRAKQLQSEIDTTFGRAYAALQQANITMGVITNYAREIKMDESITVQFRSVMGVEIPVVEIGEQTDTELRYGYTDTNAAFDEAYANFVKVKHFAAELAEVENSVYRLAFAVKKTQKRANALKNIVIPSTLGIIKYISSYLEEKDREEFSRLKIIKKNKSI